MILFTSLAGLAGLSLVLLLWQTWAGLKFPLHVSTRGLASGNLPQLALLKPLKGADPATEQCLRSWFTQEYPAPWHLFFGVADSGDPVCEIVRELQNEFPHVHSTLRICPEALGPNAKVSTLVQLEEQAVADIVVVSDADVRVPPKFLWELTGTFQTPAIGLVHCLYQLTSPQTRAMQWEALAVNADFWSQVLQSRMLQPMNFALGAVMAVRLEALKKMGGFRSLLRHLADDYQLGHKVHSAGYRVELAQTTVQCWERSGGWRSVWDHQLRWARTVRAVQPIPYFFSILQNPLLWPALWWIAFPRSILAGGFLISLFLLRMLCARMLERHFTQPHPQRTPLWLIPLKDFLAVGLWAAAFTGRHVEWRGERYRVRRGGYLEPFLHPETRRG